jgi:hypothetical protein
VRSLHSHKDPITVVWLRLEYLRQLYYIGKQQDDHLRLRSMTRTAATARRFTRPPTLSGVWEVCARG